MSCYTEFILFLYINNLIVAGLCVYIKISITLFTLTEILDKADNRNVRKKDTKDVRTKDRPKFTSLDICQTLLVFCNAELQSFVKKEI